jgi:predicted metal-dependent hydrolase
MRFLVRLIPRDPDRAAILSTIRSITTNLGGSAVNPKWTSYGALEIDIFAPSSQDFEIVMAAIAPLLENVEFAKDLQEAPPFLPKERAIDEAVALFNAERFWEAHEVLESLWRVAEGTEKKLLQGLILACAAFVHHQKGESKVALGVARRALPLLVWTGPDYFVIDVTGIRERMTRMVEDGTLSLFRL